MTFDQVPEEPRLQRGRELSDIVEHRHARLFSGRQADLPQADDVEAFVRGRLRRSIEKQHAETNIRVKLAERAEQHPRMRQVITRNDGANLELHRLQSFIHASRAGNVTNSKFKQINSPVSCFRSLGSLCESGLPLFSRVGSIRTER